MWNVSRKSCYQWILERRSCGIELIYMPFILDCCYVGNNDSCSLRSLRSWENSWIAPTNLGEQPFAPTNFTGYRPLETFLPKAQCQKPIPIFTENYYSYLRASIGSKFAARIAGISPAKSPTKIETSEAIQTKLYGI